MKQKTKEQLLEELEYLKGKVAELEGNKEYSQIIAENTSDNIAITTFDLKAKYLYVSPSVKQVLGYDPEDMIGRSFFEFIHPDDKKVLFQLLKKYINKIVKKVLKINDPDIVEKIEFRFKDKSGDWHHLESTINFVDKNLLAVTRDVTKTKLASKAIIQRDCYLDALNKATALLLRNNDIPYQEFTNIIGKASGASRTYIFINHPNKKDELLTSQIAEYCEPGVKPEIDNPELQNLPLDEWIPRWKKTLSAGDIINGNIANFPLSEREILEPQNIKSILVIPITIKNNFWGFIGFDNCTTEREWNPIEVDFLKAAAKNLELEIIRNKAQLLLKFDNLRFQTTMNAIDAVVYVADFQTYELLFTNNSFNNLMGNHLGQNCFSVIQEGKTKPCDFCTNHLLLNKKGAPKKPHVWEFQNTKTNRWYQCRDQAIRWTDGRLVRLEVATDITDRKNAEQILKENEEQYRQLFELLPYGGEVLDTKGIIINCSPSTSRMLGYELDELIGKHITNFVDDETIKIFKNKFPQLLTGAILSTEACLVHKDGTKIDVLRAAQPIFDDSGKVNSVLVLNVDISDRKKAEKELQERNEELDAFSHTVAHDLKNPLSTILGFSKILKQDYLKLTNNEIYNYLEKIIGSTNKTHQIINSLLLLANVRKAEIVTEKLNMEEIVAESIRRLSHATAGNNVKIILPDSWPVTIATPQWIEEVWVNYISNAIKYGGNPPIIEIGFDPEEAKDGTAEMVRYWVRDNGKGISHADQKVLFKKFERLDQAGTQGHGLGLSIVQRIIEKLGGKVGVKSKINKGSLFYFTLPLSTKSKQLVRRSTSTVEVSETQQSAEVLVKKGKLKVLIAEDERTSDELLSILIENISKETLHAKTGKETIELCSQNPDIDLILMDIKMPKMSGYTATRKIRETNKDVVIIAQTAYAMLGDREKALAAGCDDYITKPIDKIVLMEMIERLVSGSRFEV